MLDRFTDESLRWLVANGRVKEAERILRKAAALNGADIKKVLHVFRSKALQHVSRRTTAAELKPMNQVDQVDQAGPTTSEDTSKYSVLDFVRHRSVLLCTAINGFAW